MIALTIASILAITSIASAQTTCGITNQWTFITNQTNLESLSGCTKIKGSLSVTRVASLASLAKVRSIEGSLSIVSNTITDMTGLSALQAVGDELRIERNHNLTNLSGLSSLQSAGSLYVSRCNTLESISALANLTTITSTSRNSSGVSLIHNKLLYSLDGLQGLKSCGSALVLDGLPRLVSLSPLGSTAISAPESITLINLTHVVDMSSLKGFSTVSPTKTSITVTRVGVSSLSGFENINSIGSLTIADNSKLNDISAIARGSNIPSIAGPVRIENNRHLCDLKGLDISLPASLGASNVVVASTCNVNARSTSSPSPTRVSSGAVTWYYLPSHFNCVVPAAISLVGVCFALILI